MSIAVDVEISDEDFGFSSVHAVFYKLSCLRFQMHTRRESIQRIGHKGDRTD